MPEFGRLGCDNVFLSAPRRNASGWSMVESPRENPSVEGQYNLVIEAHVGDEMSDHGPSELSNKVPEPVQKTSPFCWVDCIVATSPTVVDQVAGGRGNRCHFRSKLGRMLLAVKR
jgi:hypothetical protein